LPAGNPNVAGDEDRDTDGDGVSDYDEVQQGTSPTDDTDAQDSDGDGVPDTIEEEQGTDPNDAEDAGDTDGDGVPDYVETVLWPNQGLPAGDPNVAGDEDRDSDGDGVSDYDEVQQGTSPTDDTDAQDSDGDGVPDAIEEEQGTDPNDAEDAGDTDGDGVPDYVETVLWPNQGLPAGDPNVAGDEDRDSDGDGIPDFQEVLEGINQSKLSYSPGTQTVRQGIALTAMIPTYSGGTARYTISPALPDGLRLNATTGVINGTLTVPQTGTVTYTVTASNNGENTTATITLVFNTAPTGIALSSSSVGENAASGTTVGALSATDADTGDTFTYALVSGTGDTDNASFAISGATLKTAAVFDFETKNSYSLRLRVTDAGGLTFERAFTITVTDVNEDRDGDGVKDDEERADGTDPVDACSFKIASQNAAPSEAWKAADCDNDGLTNQKEKDLSTDPLKADTDGDDVPDGVEVTDGTDPLDATKYKDTDGDLVPNFVETANGTDTGNSLNYKDSDKDGVPDYLELRDGTDPNSASSFKDTDNGGVPDYVETVLFPNLGLAATDATQRGDDKQDTDGDDVSDYQEFLDGTNPKDPSEFKDSDGDGVPNAVEIKEGTNPNNPLDVKDSDKDGVPDYIQIRSVKSIALENLVLVWGEKNYLSALPKQVDVVIFSGEKRNVNVVWEKTESINILKRGTYELKGTIVLPKGYYNPYKINGVIRVVVLPKPAPRDVTITKDTFLGSASVFFISVGDFMVDDPVDNIHVVSLLGDGYDNKYFEIKENILFWSSAERAPGKTKFSIVVRVTDRDGNTLDKFFEIKRTRPEFSSVTIFNTFTPNGDQINEIWGVPEIRFYEGVRISVYDRGGSRLFYTENPDVRWDGTYNGKELPVGSYYWVIQIEETGETRRGVLNLIGK
jgi:gliding motility-associated-like protein